MSTRPDLEAYVLGELPEAARRDVEQYLASNPEAAAEVERLQMVAAALRRLPEEEPPRRIAFVSDKVFEPKWYYRLWNSAPRLAFGSAMMLAGAIVMHGYLTMPPRPVVTAVDSQEITRRVDVELNRRLDASMARAVSTVRAEADAKSKQMVNAALTEAERRFALERQADRVAVDASFDVIRKQMNLLAKKYNLASNQTPGAGQ